MENPNLTVITPTLLTGDSSLDSTVMHEIGHSWFGNLVTNKEWCYFFINEGFNVYFELKILAKVYDKNLANLK